MTNLVARISYDGQTPTSAMWVPAYLPTQRARELIGDAKTWLVNGSAPAVLGATNPKTTEILLFIELVPGTNDVLLTPAPELEEMAKTMIVDARDVRPLVPFAIDLHASSAPLVATHGVEYVDFSSPAVNCIRHEAHVRGIKIWCHAFHGFGSRLVPFAGKVVRSDCTNPDPNLVEMGGTIDIGFEGADAYFEQSGGSELAYAPGSIADGQSFPFSGIAVVGDDQDEDAVAPDGAVYASLLTEDGVAVFDGYMPGGPLVTDTPLPPQAKRIRASSMQAHPLGQHPDTHATGGRYAFGSPFHGAPLDPAQFHVLRDATDVECFRPVHRLEEDGSPVLAANHPNMETWSSYPDTRRSGTDRLGKSSDAFGDPGGGWKPQDGAHIAYHGVAVMALCQCDSIAIDTLEAEYQMLVPSVDYWKRARYAGQELKTTAEIGQTPVAVGPNALTHLETELASIVDFLTDPQQCNIDRHGGPMRPFAASTSYSNYVPGLSWAVIQQALGAQIPPHVEALNPDLVRGELAVLFADILTTTLTDGFYPMGDRLIPYFVVGMKSDGSQNTNTAGDDPAVVIAEQRAKGSSSHTLISLQCCPGFVWLLRNVALDELTERKVRGFLQALWVDDPTNPNAPHAARWLGAWITRAELFGEVPEPPIVIDPDPTDPSRVFETHAVMMVGDGARFTNDTGDPVVLVGRVVDGVAVGWNEDEWLAVANGETVTP